MGAVGTLLHHSVNSNMELARVLYHVCESKFMAESAPGVGKYTDVMVLDPGVPIKQGCELSDDFVNAIRADWEEKGKPRIPQTTLDNIRKQLQTGSFGGDSTKQ